MFSYKYPKGNTEYYSINIAESWNPNNWKWLKSILNASNFISFIFHRINKQKA